MDETTDIEPGMVVEATKGDLGEEDVSKKVTEVVQDQQGNVDKLVVKKGVIFKKLLRFQPIAFNLSSKKTGKSRVHQAKSLLTSAKKKLHR